MSRINLWVMFFRQELQKEESASSYDIMFYLLYLLVLSKRVGEETGRMLLFDSKFQNNKCS